MFYLEECPHCKKAQSLEDSLILSNPEYKNLVIRRVNERLNRDFADKFNYYYVPTYYVEGKKIHEGAIEQEDVKKVFDLALK